MEIDVLNRHRSLRGPTIATRRLFAAVLRSVQKYRPPGDELSIAFVDDNEIARLHDEFMDDPTPTDVITFHGDPEFNFAGEIVVSVDHALTQAHARNIPFSQELTLYLIHGWLHLAGLNDRDPDSRAAMRNAEREVLASLPPNLPVFALKT